MARSVRTVRNAAISPGDSNQRTVALMRLFMSLHLRKPGDRWTRPAHSNITCCGRTGQGLVRRRSGLVRTRVITCRGEQELVVDEWSALVYDMTDRKSTRLNSSH